MKPKTKKQTQWQQYAQQNRRVTFSLAKQEYNAFAKHATEQGRTPGQQVWLESLAYRNQRYLPTQSIAQQIHELQVSIRQLHSALQHRTTLDQPVFLQRLRTADHYLQRFVQPTHDPQKS